MAEPWVAAAAAVEVVKDRGSQWRVGMYGPPSSIGWGQQASGHGRGEKSEAAEAWHSHGSQQQLQWRWFFTNCFRASAGTSADALLGDENPRSTADCTQFDSNLDQGRPPTPALASTSPAGPPTSNTTPPSSPTPPHPPHLPPHLPPHKPRPHPLPPPPHPSLIPAITFAPLPSLLWPSACWHCWLLLCWLNGGELGRRRGGGETREYGGGGMHARMRQVDVAMRASGMMGGGGAESADELSLEQLMGVSRWCVLRAVEVGVTARLAEKLGQMEERKREEARERVREEERRVRDERKREEEWERVREEENKRVREEERRREVEKNSVREEKRTMVSEEERNRMREEGRRRVGEEEANKKREDDRKSSEALETRTKRREEELKSALSEAERAVVGLEASIDQKVNEILAQALLLRRVVEAKVTFESTQKSSRFMEAEAEEEAEMPFQAAAGGGAGRKRARMADGLAVGHRMKEVRVIGQSIPFQCSPFHATHVIAPIPLPHPAPPSRSPIPLPHPAPPSRSPIPLPHPAPPSRSPIPLPHPAPPSRSPIPLPHPTPISPSSALPHASIGQLIADRHSPQPFPHCLLTVLLAHHHSTPLLPNRPRLAPTLLLVAAPFLVASPPCVLSLAAPGHPFNPCRGREKAQEVKSQVRGLWKRHGLEGGPEQVDVEEAEEEEREKEERREKEEEEKEAGEEEEEAEENEEAEVEREDEEMRAVEEEVGDSYNLVQPRAQARLAAAGLAQRGGMGDRGLGGGAGGAMPVAGEEGRRGVGVAGGVDGNGLLHARAGQGAQGAQWDPPNLNLHTHSASANAQQPLERLRELHISQVSDALLRDVAMLGRLEAFSCTCSEGVTPSGWEQLRSLTKLTRLQVAPANLEDHYLELQFRCDSLPDISRVSQRPTPYIKRVCDCGDGLCNPKHPCVDGSVWQVVGALQGLQQLGVHGVARSEEDLLALTALTRLTTLHITGTHLHDDAYFREFAQLRELGLAGCSVDVDSGMAVWSYTIPQLQSLDLSATRVSYKGVSQLYLLKSLQHVKVQQCCNLRAAFVRHLSLVPQLNELDLGFNYVQPGWLRPVLYEKQEAGLCLRHLVHGMWCMSC
ncbi:unnamed protein product [Closterium sp. Naga37s-1]|nr:unnamed protein product [Closterium sp. Naga37s-1]